MPAVCFSVSHHAMQAPYTRTTSTVDSCVSEHWECLVSATHTHVRHTIGCCKKCLNTQQKIKPDYVIREPRSIVDHCYIIIHSWEMHVSGKTKVAHESSIFVHRHH